MSAHVATHPLCTYTAFIGNSRACTPLTRSTRVCAPAGRADGMQHRLLLLLAKAIDVASSSLECPAVPDAFEPPHGTLEIAQRDLVLQDLIHPRITRWEYYREHLVGFINAHFPLRPPLTWVEIGTAFGGTTAHILKRMPNVVAHAVDPCQPAYDAKDLTAKELERWRIAHNLTRDDFSVAWASALVKQERAFGCYHLHRAMSNIAAADFSSESIDVLFVDGLHSFEGAMADLVAYWPKLKPRSILILNDFTHDRACRSSLCRFPGVRKAACQFLETKGLAHRIIVEGPLGITNAGLVIGMELARGNVSNTCALLT